MQLPESKHVSHLRKRKKKKKKRQIYQKVTKVAPSTGYLLYVEYTVGFILNFATCSVVDKPCDQFLGLV